jgi:hypothetical protein
MGGRLNLTKYTVKMDRWMNSGNLQSRDAKLGKFKQWWVRDIGGWHRPLISPPLPTKRVPRPSRTLRRAGVGNACAIGSITQLELATAAYRKRYVTRLSSLL